VKSRNTIAFGRSNRTVPLDLHPPGPVTASSLTLASTRTDRATSASKVSSNSGRMRPGQG
jgi:hypothetical protein